MQLTRLLLCKGRISKVRTCLVRLAIPRPAIADPVRTPPVVIAAAPAVPPRNTPVPVIPIAEKAPARPTPITGAKRPADSPSTRPPPKKREDSVNRCWQLRVIHTQSSQA